jgi:signal transduction histidine kinase
VAETTATDESLAPHQLERLLDVGRRLVSELDHETVLGQVVEAARELTGARYAALGVLEDSKAELERFIYSGIDEDTRQRIGPLPRGHGILGELIRDPRVLRLARISDHPRSYGFPVEHPPMTTFVGAPVMIRGEVYGNLYLTDKHDGEEFDPRDERLVEVLAEWAAVAIDNARNHEKLVSRRADLERLLRALEVTASLSIELGGESDLGRVLELVSKRGRALVEARSCAALLSEGDGLYVAEASGEIPSAAVGRRLAETSPAQDVLRAEVSQRSRAGAGAAFRELGIEAAAVLIVPLRSRGRNLGVLAAFDRIDDDPVFTRDDQLAMESFAASAASAIGAAISIEEEKTKLSIASRDREKGRWARELHDETLQELAALQVIQEAGLKAESVDAARDALASAIDQVERTIASLRSLITELRPAALDDLGVAAALESLVERIEARTHLELDVDIDLAFERGDAATRPTAELESTVYRLVQEALSNVAKHANAERARVAVEERDGEVSVVVEDDGQGFAPGETPTGFGLIGMRERVDSAGGELTIGPGPDGGTRVSARLPVVRREGAGSEPG